MNCFPSRVLESLDSTNVDNSNDQSHEFLSFVCRVDKVNKDVDGVGGNFNLDMDLNTLEKIVNENTPSSCPTEFSLACHDIFWDGAVSNSGISYLDSFKEPFKELVYPRGDPDAVTLTMRDIGLLQPATYINDTIIDFYIHYLKNKIEKKEKSRFHFFNSFFFQKLTDMDKNPSNACDGKAAFLRVRKWTRKVNLFEKDYIFIPVNFNLHWSLIVICHPGEVVNINDTKPDESHRVPCILHLDSVSGYHSGLKEIVQSYLWEEWKERKRDTCGEKLLPRFLNMQFLPVGVPQQENSYDCGLFLLHYLERFLAEAPVNFNPSKLTKFSNFLNLDWFLPAEASLKRTVIHKLIFELVENYGSHEDFSSDNGDDHHCSKYNNMIAGQCHAINGETSTSHSGRGIEMATLFASYMRSPSFDQLSSNQCLNGSIYAMEEVRPLLEDKRGEINSMSIENLEHLPDMNGDATVNLSVDSPINFSEHWNIISAGNKNGYPHMSCQETPTLHWHQVSDAVDKKGINDDVQTIDNIKLDFCEEQAAKKRRLMSLDTSCCPSDDSDDIAIIENFSDKKESLEDKRRERNWLSIENLEQFSAVNDYPPTINFAIMMCAGNKNECRHLSTKKRRLGTDELELKY